VARCFTGIVSIFAGRQNLAVAQAVGYAIYALFVSIGVSTFLRNRNVSLRDVWRWSPVEGTAGKSEARWRRRRLLASSVPLMLLAGAVGGVLLGLFAHGYLAALFHFPTVAELIRNSQEQMTKIPGLRPSYTFMAVLVAPFTEEYLFRGCSFEH
jgi:hypothetical protein